MCGDGRQTGSVAPDTGYRLPAPLVCGAVWCGVVWCGGYPVFDYLASPMCEFYFVERKNVLVLSCCCCDCANSSLLCRSSSVYRTDALPCVQGTEDGDVRRKRATRETARPVPRSRFGICKRCRVV